MSPTPASEDYLKALFHLESEEERVPTTAIADSLGVAKPSVTGMLKRLREDDYVDYSPRQGARLTATGRAATLQVIRRHRLLETFFVEMLGLDWSEVHDDAEVLEHHLSDRIVDAIDRALGYPTEDPHGHPIPSADGELAHRELVELAGLEEGRGGTVREVHTKEHRRLRRWAELGFKPGTRVRVVRRQDLEDVLHVRVGREIVVTGTAGVRGILVELS